MVAQRVEIVSEHQDDGTDRGELLRRLGELPHREQAIIADDLEIDGRYQRPLREKWVRAIAEGFDPVKLRPLLVNERSEGRRFVMDGQHRLAAIRAMGYGDQLVPCLVYENLPYEIEAQLFDTQDSTRTLTPQQRFRSALQRGAPEERIIDGLVRQAGFSLNLTDGELTVGRIAAVAALKTIHRQFKTGDLAAVLTILCDAFGTDQGPRHMVLLGLARFHARFRGEYDRHHLIKRLQTKTMHSVGGEGIDIAKALGLQTAEGVGRSIYKVYNENLRANRLEPWEARDGRSSRKAA